VQDGAAGDLELWDSVATAYAALPADDRFDEFLDRHLGNVAGKRVLDLGCGHGWFAGALHERGAEVVGIDGSEQLLAIARREHPNVDFRFVDLNDGIEGTFDVVVALMVLMDVPDLAVLRPQLAPDGVLVATILHPAFFNQRTVDDEHGGYRMVRGYLDHETWWIESFGGHRHYHRPLGAYVEWLASLGLGVVELLEPSTPAYEGGWRARIPTRLGIAARPIA
jgi:SAM-dependent methyltransferase